jgi:carbonic anhydrase
VVPEILFDQHLGELFVVRVAGNVASPEVMASIEFAVLRFGSPLLVVMGHTDCGAVSAAIAELSEPTSDTPRNIKGLVDRMIPAIKSVRPHQDEDGAWMREAVRANVAASLRRLLQNSGPIKEAVGAQTLTAVGAEYNLSTGAVEFLD